MKNANSIVSIHQRSCADLNWGKDPPFMATKDTFRVVTRAKDGSLLIRDFHSAESILESHSQIGTDDCSTDLDIRGMPVFRGLIGPFPEGKNVVRYESPEVFEVLTKEWVNRKPKRRRRRSSAEVAAAREAEAAALAAARSSDDIIANANEQIDAAEKALKSLED